MKVAINGFGRIGRLVFRIAIDSGVNVVAVNDIYGAKDATYLLRHDSVYGKYAKKVDVKGGDIIVNGKRIKVLQERDPGKLPWKKLGVDVVVEATGAFRSREGAGKHLSSGAKYVLITAPMKEGKADLTLVPGVNDKKLKKDNKIISIASCTTNCLAPMVKILNDNFGIENAFMTTVHAYTSSQSVVDGSARKVERGRAAAVNIVPTSTGASDAVIEAIPELKGKIDGMAMRVPVISGSITDLTARVNKNINVEKVNNAFKKASKESMKGVLRYSEEVLVSSDIVGDSHSVIFNSGDTKVNGNLVKITGWYDNEYGYSSRVVDAIKMLKSWC